MTISISSAAGGSGAADSSARVSSVAGVSSESAKGSTSSSAETADITKFSELKKAELRGASVTVSDEAIVKEVERAIRAVQGRTTTLEFSVHQKTNLVAVKVLDKDNGEVIREIPPEKTLDFVAKLWEMAGVLVDERR